MQSRTDEAIARHNKGYNCAQAVACTYCELEGMSEDEMFRVMEGFGLGMGGMDGVCGAVSGAVALAGLANSSGCSDPVSKSSTYKLSRQILDEFKHKNGSLICRELKGADTGHVLCSCSDCIRDAAALAEKIIFTDD